MKLKSGNILIIVGLLLIAAALLLTMNNIRDNVNAGKAADSALDSVRGQIEENSQNVAETSDNRPLYEKYPDLEMPELEGGYIGILKIPAIGIELPVRGEYDYYSLDVAPCRYSGSVYKNNMIIAGHNYYNHFGLLYRLKPDDDVTFVDGDGNVFNYKVIEVVQINGTDVDGMKEGDWDMTLFTCNFSGSQRVTIRLELQ